jgi:hypothetical protein
MPPCEGEKQHFFKAIQVWGNRSAPKPDIRISVGLIADTCTQKGTTVVKCNN